MQAPPGGRRAGVIARRQQHLGARRDSIRRQALCITRLRDAAEGRDRAARRQDPRSEFPDYKWEDGGPVVWSDGVEDSNAIDPGVFRDPANGSLWLTYGSYFGYIRLVEINPKTGKRLYPGGSRSNIAINGEASIIISATGGTTC